MTRLDRIKHIQTLVGAKPDGVIGNETLTKFQCKFQVPNKATVAHFFGNMHHESGNYTIVEEDMHYITIARIRAMWPSRFPTDASAQPYLRNPIGLANKVYNGRMGNTGPNDGYMYRGRGLMQTTGKYSYNLLSQFLKVDVVSNPTLVSSQYYFQSAIHMFNEKKLWNRVSGVTESDIRIVRKLINGGYNGIADVINKVRYYYNLMR